MLLTRIRRKSPGLAGSVMGCPQRGSPQMAVPDFCADRRAPSPLCPPQLLAEGLLGSASIVKPTELTPIDSNWNLAGAPTSSFAGT
jgi:hypothetical protein